MGILQCTTQCQVREYCPAKLPSLLLPHFQKILTACRLHPHFRSLLYLPEDIHWYLPVFHYLQHCRKRRISTHSVIMSVPHDHAAVKVHNLLQPLPGTTSISADRKSSSSYPYSFGRIFKIFAFTRYHLGFFFFFTCKRNTSNKKIKFSPSITLDAFFSICSPAR